MRTLTSTDGTSIAYETIGSGAPIVLVGGAISDRTLWRAVVPLLAGSATVYTMDRRGRGDSGDRTGSGVDDEINDVCAIVAEAGDGVLLVGHSSGALLALRAAARCTGLRGVVAYEPPPPPPGGPVAAELRALVNAGDADAALTLFMTAAVGLPLDVVQARRGSPEWTELLAFARSTPYDAAIVEEGLPPATRIGVPVRMLLGGASPQPMADNTRLVLAQLSAGEVAILDGQQHFAITAAPETFASHVLQ
jgi:pimeloyl-ACP methyl ester carboxylesterase